MKSTPYFDIIIGVLSLSAILLTCRPHMRWAYLPEDVIPQKLPKTSLTEAKTPEAPINRSNSIQVDKAELKKKKNIPVETLFLDHPELKHAYLAAAEANFEIQFIRIFGATDSALLKMEMLKSANADKEITWADVQTFLLQTTGEPKDIAAGRSLVKEKEKIFSKRLLEVLGPASAKEYKELANSAKYRTIEQLISGSYALGSPLSREQALFFLNEMDGVPRNLKSTEFHISETLKKFNQSFDDKQMGLISKYLDSIVLQELNSQK